MTRCLRSAEGIFCAVGERQLDVFIDGQIADQIEALEDEADLLIADARALGKVKVLGRLAVERISCRRSACRAGR